MSKHISWSGTHPLAEVAQERDEWQARAEAAERDLAAAQARIEELEAQLAGPQAWRLVALSVGKSLADDTPDNYHEMTPVQWGTWVRHELESQLAALDDSRYPDYINNGARYEWVGRKGYVLKSMAVSVELDPPAPA